MKVVPYCVVPETCHEIPVSPGIASDPVQCVVVGDLITFYSEGDFHFDSAASVRLGALEFHRVHRGLLPRFDLVPFRFPTFFANVAELSAFVRHNCELFQACLRAVRGCVQMEIRLHAEPDTRLPAPADGTSYLRSKAAQLGRQELWARELETRLASGILKSRHLSRGEALQYYALVVRERADEFRTLAAESVPKGSHARITGPWPPAQFMPIESFTRGTAIDER